MDKTTKFILGLIAVALIGINIQMWDGKLIKDAYALGGLDRGTNVNFNVCYQREGVHSMTGILGLNNSDRRWGRCHKSM